MTTATKPAKMTGRRHQLVQGLEKLGGELVAEPGKTLRPMEVANALGIEANERTFTAFLRNAEESGIIRRKVKGRATHAIYLVHGKPKTTKKTTAKSGPGKVGRPRSKHLNDLALPKLGDRVEVYMLHRDAEGELMLGLRNDQGSWTTTVAGFAAAEVAS